MSRWFVRGVGLGMTLICLMLFLQPPLFVRNLENLLYDHLLRQVAVKEHSRSVAVIDIDEASLQDPELGQWPWPRDKIAEMTDRLFDAGAAVVAFDVMWPEADRTSPELMRDKLQQRHGAEVALDEVPEAFHNYDTLLAESFRGKKVVLGCFLNKPTERVTPDMLDRVPEVHHYAGPVSFRTPAGDRTALHEVAVVANGIQQSLPVISEAAAATGFYNSSPDSDNIVRRNPLVMSYGKRRAYPSLALEAVRQFLGAHQVLVELDRSGIGSVRLNDLDVPVDAMGNAYINFRRSVGERGASRISFQPNFSARDLFSGKLGAEELGGRIVFIGTSAEGLRDIRATPLESSYSGVEIQATLVDNILAGDMLRMPTWLRIVDILLIPLVGLMLTQLAARGNASANFLLSLALIAGALAASYWLLKTQHLVYRPAMLVLTVLMLYPVLTMIRYWQKEGEVRWIRAAFGTMVSPEVLDYLEENRHAMSWSGRKVDATMMFVDLQDFTNMSEQMKPTDLADLLNEYLSPMTRIIWDHSGSVDKYSGDMIMACWGVLKPIPDHPAQACLSGLAQRDKLDAIRSDLEAKFGHKIYFRMGINTGQVTAGMMGSEMHREFSVLGDAVNLAARLEPMGKEYGCSILIGPETYERAKGVVEARRLDEVQVRGKEQAVFIYELLGRKGEVDAAVLRMARAYERGLGAWQRGEMVQARAFLEDALREVPDDKPSLRLMDRLVLPDETFAALAQRMRTTEQSVAR